MMAFILAKFHFYLIDILSVVSLNDFGVIIAVVNFYWTPFFISYLEKEVASLSPLTILNSFSVINLYKY